VLELRGEACFVEKHPQEVDVARSLAQHALEHDVSRDTGDARASGEKDLCHPAGRELCEDLVAARRGADLEGRRRHADKS
jgi:hypothetical protein